MQVYVPYTKVNPVTRITLWDYDPKFVKVSGKYGYSKFFKERWGKGEDFINVEHDVVVWPGAIDSLIDCPDTWCVFDYTNINWSTQEATLNEVPLVCVKITSKMIKILPGCWNKSVEWFHCGMHLFQVAQAVGLTPHQHFPGVVNGNLALLGRRRI